MNSKKIELKRKLKENGYERWENSSSGEKLDTKKLHLIGLDKNIFLKRVKGSGRSYAVEILVDISGSMFPGANNYIKRCLHSVMEIIKLLYGVVNINVVFFDIVEYPKNIRDIWSVASKPMGKSWECFDALVHWCELNEYDDRIEIVKGEKIYLDSENDISDIRKKEGNNNKLYLSCRGNWEVINLVNAAERLNRKSEEDKAIVIVGDGQLQHDSLTIPTKGRDIIICGKKKSKYNAGNYKEHVEQIEKTIPILGIGLGTSYAQYIPNSVVSSNISDVQDHIVTFFYDKFG